MTDFDYDCLQKKRIANQAKYRKRGSRSKKCNLPSDRLTHKQWKERCGPVVTYNLSNPMNWEDFKQLPVYIQAEYITNLQNKYGVTAVDLAEMFGVKPLTVRRHSEANNLSVTFHRGHAMTPARKAEWKKFLDPAGVGDETVNAEEAAVVSAEPVEEPVPEPEKVVFSCPPPEEVIAPVEPKSMNMTNFSLRFKGNLDVGTIANSLKLIMGNQSSGELEIICNLA